MPSISRRPLLQAACAAALSLTPWLAAAQQAVLNLYSARHYQTDEALYTRFTKATGIQINRLEAKEDELLERLRNEGERSPADVLLTVDAARLEVADARGLFQPLNAKGLTARIPAALRTENWAAFSTRARVILYNKAQIRPEQVQTYEALAAPSLGKRLCMRSGGHPYNLSLGAALIAHNGEAATEQWARGLVANFARPPRGGDTDQIRAVAAGECGVTVSNSYYVARLLRSSDPKDQEAMAQVGIVWPNQRSWGAHINVSGAGILKHAPNPQAARQFLEYLASDEAQVYFANGNNEWPVVPGVKVNNPALATMGAFKADALPIGELAKTTALAQKVFDRAGWR